MQASLEDSNIAHVGSADDHAARKAAAQTDEHFAALLADLHAEAPAGLRVWRVENKQSSKGPGFGIAPWPKEDYGDFYSGDSYLVLNSYYSNSKLLHDVHFWLGAESSQDEVGVAAYKAVELDDLLDDVPVQHREVQGHESPLFQSYFEPTGGLRYLRGGVASGFRHVEPEEYEPRLLHVRRTRKTIRATQADVALSSLNHGDVFVLDAGLRVYLWCGDAASPFEKAKGAALQHNIISARHGKPAKGDADSDEFWAALGGGSAADVQPAVERDEEPNAEAIDAQTCSLHRLSDASGALEFSEVAPAGGGALKLDMLDDGDVFVVNGEAQVFCWIGSKASRKERSSAMQYAEAFLRSKGMPSHTPITRIKSGQNSTAFASCFGVVA